MNNLLKIENVRKTYPSFTLKDVSFEVKPGQIMGFIGRNGAGKTTTLKGAAVACRRTNLFTFLHTEDCAHDVGFNTEVTQHT